MTNPNVEVFVLNYNGERYLAEALDTILSQTYKSVRVIFSDNGSTDRSLAVASRFESRGLEIRVRNPGTGGIFTHYNLCLSEAEAPYVAIFHNDDLYDSKIIEEEVAVLEKHAELDIVLTGGGYIGANGEKLWPATAPNGLIAPVLDRRQVIEHMMRHGNSFLLAPSAMFRTASMKKIGGFALDCRNSGDVEMWLRVLTKGKGLGYVPKPLYFHRITADQTSGKGENARLVPSDFFEVMDRYVPSADVSEKAKHDYESLRRLDLLHVGLNQFGLRGDETLLRDQLTWFASADLKNLLKNFGIVDRIKVRGALAMKPFLSGAMGRWIARTWVRVTDPRTSPMLRAILKLKRLRKARGQA